MSALITREQVNRISGQIWPLPGLSTPGEKPKPFRLVGSDRRWSDRAFGMTECPEDMIRAIHQRVLVTVTFSLHGKFNLASAPKEEPLEAAALIPDADAEAYEARQLSEADAETEIMEYLRGHPGEDAHDLAIVLHLDPALSIRICHRLVDEGRLEFAHQQDGE